MSQAEARAVDRPVAQHDAAERPVIVLDFGAQYAQLIARRIRELRVYSEILPYDTPVDDLRRRDPLGIVLSGGPASIHEPGAPVLDPAVLELGVPVLGICYGMQA
ncbi:MAG: GMP synthase (glutamine-hydrolyzing), partial [Gaiellales bacterium]